VFERFGRSAHAWPVVVLVAAAMVIGACGGSNDDQGANAPASGSQSTADLDYAKSQVEKHKAIPAFEAPGPAFDPSGARGKVIFEIPLASTIPFMAATSKEMQKVADRFGIDYITFPNEGQPSQWVQGFNQAIARKVDLIVLQGAPDPYALQPQLKAAKRAGIPVLVTFIISEEEKPAPNVTALVRTPGPRRLRVLSDAVIADTKGKGNVLIVTSNEIHVAQQIVPAMEDEFKTRCPDCEIKVVNVPLADWATKIQTTVQSEITSNPNLDYVIPIFDGMAQFAVAGITAAGAKDRVAIATSDGTPAALKEIQNGNVIKFEIGTDANWIAWANMDQAMRILSGAGALESGDEKLPLRLFDKTNVDDTGTPPVLGKGYGDAYVAGFEDLWKQ
jgi:ribose transport system substrate-binding protein